LIQVCWQLSAENIARERDGLVDAMNFFKLEKGVIVTFDQEDKMIVDGKVIEIVPFWKVFGEQNYG
ncbi:ATP-binding protein, partial [Avibacterium avium]